jgi:hypothetical protein
MIELKCFKHLLFIIFNTIQIILIHFSLVFHNYSLILFGKFNKKINLQFVIKFLIIFIIFLTLSIILGVPRIYLIWVSQAIFELNRI